MKIFISILFLVLSFVLVKKNIASASPDFQWGNVSYFNLGIGESLTYQNEEIKLLQLKNHFNQLKIGKDTIWLKVSRRNLPKVVSGIRIFVADNKNVKALSNEPEIHGLLNKDILIGLSGLNEPLLDPNKFLFPVSFNNGFLWKTEESSYMFSYLGNDSLQPNVNAGIDINLHDARGLEKHWILSVENSTVMWVEDRSLNNEDKTTSILLKSDSQSDIYYLYEHLYNKKVEVKAGDILTRGEAIGTIWGDEYWGHLHLAVIRSDTIPSFFHRHFNVVNFFPQLYELYFRQLYSFSQVYSKGILKFGQRSDFNGGVKNVIALEEYSGKGWNLGDWNIADRVEYVSDRAVGNARLRKVLFPNKRASSTNPNNYYDFEISVRNGVYRIRAKVGDLKQASWQKIQFEDIEASTYSLDPGVFKWTSEKAVKVNDGKLTVRLYIDESNRKVAGLNEIVFQRAY